MVRKIYGLITLLGKTFAESEQEWRTLEPKRSKSTQGKHLKIGAGTGAQSSHIYPKSEAPQIPGSAQVATGVAFGLVTTELRGSSRLDMLTA